MSDTYDLDAVRQQQAAARAALAGAVDLDATDERPRHLDQTAIDACQLCDPDGYRGSVVCDHIDHAAETIRGRAAARAALDTIRQGKTNRARGTQP